MSYYVKPWSKDALFNLQSGDGKAIEIVSAKVLCKEPFHRVKSATASVSGYPTYQAVSADGITEIIEHRKMKPLFYVTDDPAVWKTVQGEWLWLDGCCPPVRHSL